MADTPPCRNSKEAPIPIESSGLQLLEGNLRRPAWSVAMTDAKKLQREIETTKESIRRGWLEMAAKPMSPDERRQLRMYLADLTSDLISLWRKLDETN